ncbi:hypothetical protein PAPPERLAPAPP_02920 [Brevundimonas phage vB_BpoS-Papperlapapp]|uniref:Uncharacterized protein n=1 Tax=Brevundimonas phage vB_BpoS-Domovoi TaxID=2948598 RepID=A0A9E7MRT9_9CAUD|nr:hypothetical protein DOMOVOI_01880 [Brevundimonas phage vB_BpoS-Domovoi]USN16033.1 hypothetical protein PAPPERLAPAPP_02920 [Brevundimonas phage vB_BpoS-Papperlapapp]
MIVYPGLHRIQCWTCTPAEARPILRAFLDEHPDKVDRLAQTFRGLTMKVIRRDDVSEQDLHEWFRVVRATQARVSKDHPVLAAKLDMLADLLHDRWLIWMRETWRQRDRRGAVDVPVKEPTEGGPAAAGHEGA